MDSKEIKFLKKIEWSLFAMLFIMIAGYFTWSDNIVITRVLKTISRMGVLAGVYIIYNEIKKFGAIDSYKIKNGTSLFLYLSYLLLGFMSFTWSTDAGFSALQWIMTVQSLVFSYFFIKSVLMINDYFPNHSIKLVAIFGNVILLLMVVFLIGMLINPAIFIRNTFGGEEARLGGNLMNPNELGMLCGIGIACYILDLPTAKNRWWTISKIIIITIALLFTGSRSSLIGVIIIIGLQIFQSKNKKIKIAIISSMLLFVPILVYKIILKDGNHERMEEIMSMTGRLPFWKALITEGLPREPLLGYGFMRIDYKDFFQSVHTYPGKMTHNTFLQVLMNLGFIGFIIAITQVIFTIVAILKQHREIKNFLLALFIPILINSFTEFGIYGETNFGILFFQFIIFLISYQKNALLTTAEKKFLQIRRPNLYNSIFQNSEYGFAFWKNEKEGLV